MDILLLCTLVLGAAMGAASVYVLGCFAFLFAEAAHVWARVCEIRHSIAERRRQRELEILDMVIERVCREKSKAG
jgi:hypothetical protein